MLRLGCRALLVRAGWLAGRQAGRPLARLRLPVSRLKVVLVVIASVVCAAELATGESRKIYRQAASRPRLPRRLPKQQQSGQLVRQFGSERKQNCRRELLPRISRAAQ